MEKKSSGRGLNEISNIFLSSAKKEEKKSVNGLSAVTIRTNASCRSCANMYQGSAGELKCRIFTFEYKRYGVPHLSTVDPSYANYCQNYESEHIDTPEGHSAPVPGKESPPVGTDFVVPHVDIKELAAIISELDRDYSEIQETITVTQRLTYPENENAPGQMKKALMKFLDNGYLLQHVELKRTGRARTTKGTEIREEKIILSTKRHS